MQDVINLGFQLRSAWIQTSRPFLTVFSFGLAIHKDLSLFLVAVLVENGWEYVCSSPFLGLSWSLHMVTVEASLLTAGADSSSRGEVDPAEGSGRSQGSPLLSVTNPEKQG